MPTDLGPLLAEARIDKTIVVQAAPTLAETEFLLELADGNQFIAGVVGWVDLTAPNAPTAISQLADHPKLLGLRPMLQDLPDDDWLITADLGPAVGAMQLHGLRFDALVYPRHLTVLRDFVRRYSDLPVVVDHAAKPNIAESSFNGWARDIGKLARETNVYCKLSGLITEAGRNSSVAAIRPYVDHVLSAFGSARVMWGSDWPVVGLACSYEEWLAMTIDMLSHYPKYQQEHVFADSAAEFYGIVP